MFSYSQINIDVDGMYRKQGSTSGKFVRLSSNVMYIAGSPQTSKLAGSKVGNNFKGCMRKVSTCFYYYCFLLSTAVGSHRPGGFGNQFIQIAT